MPKTIFIPGASGFLGTALVREATHQGHHVRGLSRSPASDAKITAAGGIPVRGTLADHALLAAEAAAADAVLFFASAFPHDAGVSYNQSVLLNNAALDVIAQALLLPPTTTLSPSSSTDAPTKALIVASTALITAPDPTGAETTEKDPEDPTPYYDRASPSKHALAWASRGLRVATIRLAPAIYGPGDMIRGLAAGMAASPLGGVPVIDGGHVKTSCVHVADAARLALLAADKSPPGECYNCVSDTDTTMGQVLTAAAEALDVPVKHLAASEAEPFLGEMMAGYLTTPCRASSLKAKEVLGWEPKEVGVIDYYKSCRKASE